MIAPELLEEPVERVPVTVICSRQGWIRAVRGAGREPGRAQVQGGRRRALPPAGAEHRPAAGDRRRRPGLHAGGGQARQAAAAMASLCPWRSTSTRAWRSWTCACTGPRAGWCSPPAKGFGFVAEEKEIAAQTRAGKQVVNLSAGRHAAGGRAGRGRSSGAGRQQPQAADLSGGRTAGAGARQGCDADAAEGCASSPTSRTLDLPQGLSWGANGKERRVADLAGWRGAARRQRPHGAPRLSAQQSLQLM